MMSIFFLLAILPASAPFDGAAQPVIIDFLEPVNWAAVNDGVMGGLSQSWFEQVDGQARFTGELSLENNGGFASVRFANPSPDLSEFSTLVLRVRGDGRDYQLRLRDDRRMDGVAWMSRFETTEGEWQEIRLPLGEFTPTFRGRFVSGAGQLRMDRIYQVTVMLADKTSGPFRLELQDLRGVPRS